MDALTATEKTLWTTAIVAGALVVVAVAVLLTILVLLVRTIDQRVAALKLTLAQAEKNTANAAMITTIGVGVDAVLAEGLEHHLFLGRVLDKVRS